MFLQQFSYILLSLGKETFSSFQTSPPKNFRFPTWIHLFSSPTVSPTSSPTSSPTVTILLCHYWLVQFSHFGSMSFIFDSSVTFEAYTFQDFHIQLSSSWYSPAHWIQMVLARSGLRGSAVRSPKVEKNCSISFCSISLRFSASSLARSALRSLISTIVYFLRSCSSSSCRFTNSASSSTLRSSRL